ncbi:MAG: phenylacetate--CoA ligase family protein [Gammaproteobacteria bacterium]|nr:phenylacetate--CoA ligase family protein [Gammaproteobacteria bacterium]
MSEKDGPDALGALRTAVPGILWPALPDARGAAALALLHQLEHSQWWSAAQLDQAQLRQLREVVAFAAESIPFYRDRFATLGIDPRAALLEAHWRRLPILTRRDLQDHYDALRSPRLPPGHGETAVLSTSGSTGEPVKVLRTSLDDLFWRAGTLREHFWQERDFGARLASIRVTPAGVAEPPEGAVYAGWGAATDGLFRTGPAAVLSLTADLHTQLRWLHARAPAYLLSFPSNLAALADHIAGDGLAAPALREIRTVGETLSPSLRERLQRVFGAPVTDCYSTNEVGYIALQCPSGSGLYHVQAESLRVEVLHEDDRPCAPGEIGRVVVSTLHNFAMPLLRYDLRDYAEVGGPCPCGRGLATLKRILGRRRNMLVLPGGERHWPLVGFGEYRDVAPVRQYQLVQTALDRIEVRLVTDRALSAGEQERLAEVIRRWLGYPYRLEFVYLQALAASAGGKFEDFICAVDG